MAEVYLQSVYRLFDFLSATSGGMAEFVFRTDHLNDETQEYEPPSTLRIPTELWAEMGAPMHIGVQLDRVPRSAAGSER